MTKWERLRKHYQDRVDKLICEKRIDHPAYAPAVAVLNVMEYLDICEEAGDLEEAETK
jgi:hypothetical protein